MIALTSLQWTVIALLAVMYVFTCVRVAMHMRRLGRSPVAWFFVTLFLTAVPASVVMLREYRRRRDAAAAGPGRADPDAVRCPHCGAVIAGPGKETPSGVVICPECRQPLGEDRYA